MTLTSNWNILSNDENSQQSFFIDYDSEYDLSQQVPYLIEKQSVSILNNNQNEPPMTRSRITTIENTLFIPQTPSKEQCQSIIQHNINSFTNMTTKSINSIFFSKQDLSKNQFQNSLTDDINTLTHWFKSCSLNESKCNNYFSSSHKTYSNKLSSSNVTYDSNPFLKLKISSVFDKNQTQLWSRSTIQNNLSIEKHNSTSSDIFISPNKNFSHHSSPSQIVPCLLTKDSSSIIQETLFPQIKQCQIMDSDFSNKKEEEEDIVIQQSSAKFFFILIIFVVGLVFGYLHTNTFPSNLIRHWFFVIGEECIQISIKYFYLLYIYLQTIMKCLLSFLLV
ncbi:unnamed protein product [Rotaria sp. Silwood1]|nr:unnamed protein product [Rotaria sp. Silwood1]CAF1130801.1 unnamed protein product [Rotaria sp. Silwood1]